MELQLLARELALDLAAKGRRLFINVWGWNTLEERISEHADARKAFDPEYGPFSDEILEKVAECTTLQDESKAEFGTGLSTITASRPSRS